MTVSEIKFSSQVKEEDIYQVLKKNYYKEITDFYEFQRVWFSRSYEAFKDLDKYIILIYLFKRHLKTYSDYFIRKSFDEFYSQGSFEIERFNVIDVSKELNLKKETTRRKILELEEEGVIQKTKKTIKINQKAINIQRPVDVVSALSKFAAHFSKVLVKNKILKDEISIDEFEKLAKKNYTQYWTVFLNFQLPYLKRWKDFFNGDLELFIIIGMIIYNQNLNLKKNKTNEYDLNYFKYEYVKNIKKSLFSNGISAMSISEMTGIPRPTVLRKLSKLVKMKMIIKDKKSMYKSNLNSKLFREVDNLRQDMAKDISALLTKLYNFIEN